MPSLSLQPILGSVSMNALIMVIVLVVIVSVIPIIIVLL